MITMSLFVVVLLVTVVCVYGKVAKTGSVILGALLGLTLATTAFGAPLLEALTAVSTGLTDAISSAVKR